jgi:hypothetical protein
MEYVVDLRGDTTLFTDFYSKTIEDWKKGPTIARD